MKHIRVLLFICFFCSCNEEKITMIHYQLTKDDAIELEYFTGQALGATTPDVTWIRRITNRNNYLIGKIKAIFKKDSINIFRINDSLITIRFTDTTEWKGQFRDYIVNLNKTIHYNDASGYIE